MENINREENVKHLKKAVKSTRRNENQESNYFLTKEFRTLDRRQRKFTKNKRSFKKKISAEERAEKLQEMSDVLKDMKDYISDYRRKKETKLSKTGDNNNSSISKNALRKFPKPGSNPQVTFKPEEFLIKSGFMYKKGLKWHHWKKRFFRIFLDDPHNLRYYVSPRRAEIDAKLPKRLRKGKVISLLFASIYKSKSKLGTLVSKKYHKNKNIVSSFQIYIQTKQVKRIRGSREKPPSRRIILTRLYYLSCLSEVEFNNWLRTLKYVERQTNECIKKHETEIAKGLELREIYMRNNKKENIITTDEHESGQKKLQQTTFDICKYDRAQSIKGYGPGIKQCIAGEKSKFLLQDYWQHMTLGKNNTQRILHKDLLTIVIESNKLHYDIEPIRLGKSKYLVEYMLTRKGEYELSVLYDGLDIYGSPFKLYCEAAKLCSSKTFLTGENYLLASSKNRKSLEIQFRNVFEEKVGIVNDIEIEIESSIGIEIINRDVIEKLICEKDDHIVIEFMILQHRDKQANEWISVKLDDKIDSPSFKKHIKNSPYFLEIIELQASEGTKFESNEIIINNSLEKTKRDQHITQYQNYFNATSDSNNNAEFLIMQEGSTPLSMVHSDTIPQQPIDAKVLRLFHKHNDNMKNLFNFFGGDIEGMLKLCVLYDITPTFISYSQVTKIFNDIVVLGKKLAFEQFKICLAQIAIFSLSKPMFAHLYSTDKSKVNVLLTMWGLGDENKLKTLQIKQTTY